MLPATAKETMHSISSARTGASPVATDPATAPGSNDTQPAVKLLPQNAACARGAAAIPNRTPRSDHFPYLDGSSDMLAVSMDDCGLTLQADRD